MIVWRVLQGALICAEVSVEMGGERRGVRGFHFSVPDFAEI